MPTLATLVKNGQQRMQKGCDRRKWRVSFPKAPGRVSKVGSGKRDTVSVATQKLIGNLIEVFWRSNLAATGAGYPISD